MNDRPSTDQRALLQRALLTIDRLEAKLAEERAARREPIAIVGMGCRFPGGADTPEAFWELVREGRDAVTEVPKERWDVDAIFDPDPDAIGKTYTRWGAFIDDFNWFDPTFFGITRREARSIDPQQRLLLETTWEALEYGGIAPSSLAGSRGGVFVGVTGHDFSLIGAEALSHLKADAYGASGGAHSIASGRISYLLGLHGPNFALDTACSSSMVAIHCGVRALREGDADLVLAGGVTMTLSASGSIVTSRARMMSFDGRCKTFDAAADGYVRGEGCAMLAMKRLSDAERDGDRIVAVIRGTAINQDGRSTGMTAPNGRAQTAVLRAALDDAGLTPRDVNYIEAHGTGTSLGDPIELNALGEAYGDRPADEPLHVASVKTNIGHTEGAAGIAGVIKTAMAMRAREIAPHLNLETPNPLIPWDSLPVEVPLALTPWQAPAEGRLRAGVSSFGFSGTNAHLVMEEAPEPAVEADEADRPGREHTLLALSGRAREAVDAMAGRLAAHMEAHPEIGVGAVAAELGLGRSHLNQRLALPVNGRADALAKLQAAARGETPEGAARDNVRGGEAPATVFLFTGQGSQYAGMARELYDGEPVFRAALDRCAAALEGKLPRPLLPVVFGETSEDAALLDDTTYTQPALFAVEWSLAELWKSWGVVPAAAMGHSVGEYVAACVAGVFSLEDALALIAERARLMGSLPRNGAMAAVLAPEPVVRAALVGREADCAVAAVNGPENTVIAGRTETVEAILEALAAERIAAQRLTVSHAFHSPLMDPILAEFEAAAAGIAFSAPEITLISNVTGGLAGDEILTPGYWRRHLRDAVRFSDSVGTLLAEGYESFLEIGPAPVLSGMARHCPGAEKARWQGSLRKGRGERATMLAAAAALYAHGAEFDWAALQGGGRQPRSRCRLPTYAFQRERYWPDFDTRPSSVAASRSGHPYLSGAASGPVRVFRATLDLSQTPWLGDHRIYGFAPFPAAGFVDLALTAAGEARGGAVELRDVELRDSLMLPDEGAVEMQVIVGPAERGVERVRIYSQEPLPEGRADGGESPEPQWRLHVVASVGARRSAPAKANGQAERWTATPAAPADATGLDVRAYYDWLSDVGVDYGPAFQAIETIEHSGSEVWGDVRLPEHLSPQGFAVHPVIVDACSQIIGGHQLDPDDPDLSAGASMPVAIGAIRVLAPVPRQARCHVIDRETGDEDLTRCDFALFDTEGALVLEVEGLEYRRVSRDALNRIANARAQGEWHFELDWEAQPIATAARSEAAGRWLLLADESGVADRLAAKLIAQGATVAFARRGEGFARSEAGWVLDGRDPGTLHRLVAEAEQDGPLAGIVDLWPLDLAGAAALEGPDALEATHAGLLAPALGLVQAAAGKGTRIWFVTRGAQSVQGEGPDLAQAPLLAFAGVVATEQPDTPTVRIDLDPRPGPAEDALLFDAIWTPDDEDQTAFRGETRLAARLAVGTRHAAPESEPVFLHITERGVLENLTLAPLPRSAPGPNEVELRVVATGVNFRDVLNTLGMYPGDPGPLGSECAGVVSAVGAAVEGFAVGDEVVAMIDRSFATFAKADASLVVKKPATLSMAEAAGTPVAFLTADYALRELGKVQPGERVLIHAITGGVGMAAAQIARSMGAEVYGTAGTPAKRAMALAQGAIQVGDSRSLSFVEDLRAATGGEGVDFVLNALAGEFIPASLSLLREGGRFVEIGKTDEWDQARIDREYPGRRYAQLYLGDITESRPDAVCKMLERVYADFDAGVLTPLPHASWPLERAEDAFRFMAQGLHTGKIVLTQTRPDRVREDASYLVTGGLRGIGLRTAQWLAASGARHLVLVSRSGPGAEAAAAIEALEAEGVRVRTAAADVADEGAMAALFAEIATEMPPLAGIVHAAGVLDDAMLADQTPERFATVMVPKVRGGWILHRLTERMTLDFFVLFASGAGLMGAPGQANYASANGFLDALAHHRRALGLPALSVDWGSWSEVGMAAGLGEQHHRRWSAMGLGMIAPDDGVRMLGDALFGGLTAQVAIIPVHRARLPASGGPLFRRIAAPQSADAEEEGVDIAAALAEAAAKDRPALLGDWLGGQVARVLALDATQAEDRNRSLMELGMDSLMAMELHNRIKAALGVTVSAGELLTGPTVNQLLETVQGLLPEPAAGAGANSAEIEWEEDTI